MDLLSLDQYAVLSAELDAGAPRDETLAAAGVPLTLYLSSQEHWLRRIASEAARGRNTCFDQYQARFLARRRELHARTVADERDRERSKRIHAAGQRVFSTRSVPSQESVQAPLRAGLGGAGDGPRLTLAQYASLCAELAVEPEQDAAIRARYGFDESSLERERAAWEGRFAAVPDTFSEYLAHFRHYRDWMLGARAGR
jgi:hypothetical protein